MTNPPHGNDEQGRDDEARTDPDRFATQPAPTVEPTRQTPPYGPPYGTPQYGPAAQTYGQPVPPSGQPPQYGQAPQAPAPGTGIPYGRPPAAPQPYGQPQQGTPGQYGQPTYGQPGFGQPTQQYPPQYGQPGYGQPQYGTTQYGQPATGPAEKSKVGLIALATGGALLLIAVAVVLVMSLQSTVLDPAAVERDVAAQFQEREGVAIDLDCADEMEVSVDASYECTGTTADGESVTLRITITDEDAAAYTWTEP